MKLNTYKRKSSGEIYKLKGFGSRLEESGKMTTMVWIIKNDKDAKAEFIRARDFDNEFEVVK